MPFEPGKSGNPNGRPKKDKSIADILIKIGDQKYKNTNLTKQQKLLQIVYDEALKGSIPHLHFIADRTEGRAIERILQKEVEGEIVIE